MLRRGDHRRRRCSGWPRIRPRGRAAPALPRESLVGGPRDAREPAGGRRRAPGAGRVLGELVRAVRARRRPRSSASATSAAGRGGSSASTGATRAPVRPRFIRRYRWTFPNAARRRRARRQLLPPDGPADDVRARRPRAHPRDAARPAERTLADERVGKRRTQLRRWGRSREWAGGSLGSGASGAARSELSARYAVGPSRRRGGVATQRPAKPSTPVRFRSSPLSSPRVVMKFFCAS